MKSDRIKTGFRAAYAGLLAMLLTVIVSAILFPRTPFRTGLKTTVCAGAAMVAATGAAMILRSFLGRRPTFLFSAVTGLLTGLAAAFIDWHHLTWATWRPAAAVALFAVQGVGAGLLLTGLFRRLSRSDAFAWSLAFMTATLVATPVYCSVLLFERICTPDVTSLSDLSMRLVNYASGILWTSMFGVVYSWPVCVLFGGLFLWSDRVVRPPAGASSPLIRGAILGTASGLAYALLAGIAPFEPYDEYLMRGKTTAFILLVWPLSGILYATSATLLHALFSRAFDRRAARVVSCGTPEKHEPA